MGTSRIRGDSFHQVWSWYNHPLPRYTVIAADTLRDLVTLTLDLLTLVSGHTWRVTWSIPPRSLKMLRLSVLELRVLTSPIGYHWQERPGHSEARFQGEGVVPLPDQKSNEGTEYKNRDAQKKRSSHEVRVVSPEAGRESMWEKFVNVVGFERGVKERGSYEWWEW